MKKAVLIMICMVALTSCYTIQQVPMQKSYEQAFKGMTKTEIMSQLGDPTRTYADDKGEVMLYTEGDVLKDTAYTYLTFSLDNNGVCQKVATNRTYPNRVRDNKATNWAIWGSIAGSAVLAGIVVPLVFTGVNRALSR